jgi:hypothetical protein
MVAIMATDTNAISPEDASLILHRLVTERIPVIAVFMSADKSLKGTVRGFVNNFTKDKGLVICTPFDEQKPIPASLEIQHDMVRASTFSYSGETEMPRDLDVGLGITIIMPNGTNVVIFEAVRVSRFC